MVTEDRNALVASLRAHLDEDEAAAKVLGAVEGHWVVVIPEGSAEPFLASETRGRAYLALPEPMLDYLMHFARHDPARVLREVAAKRAILAAWQDNESERGEALSYTDGLADGLWLAVQSVAAVYRGPPAADAAA